MSVELDGIEALTFDCYGTLIDWDGGILAAVRAIPSLADCDHERLLHDRAVLDRKLTRSGYLPYDQVLRDSLRDAAELQDAGVTEEEAREFSASMSTWPPFDDVPPALDRLAGKFRMVVLSNVRTAVLDRSLSRLGAASFEDRITAEQIHSYKPRHAHFEEALRALSLPKDAVLHVAASPYHDLAPAEELGWRDVWVNRDATELCPGLAPTAVVRDLTELCALLGVD